MSREGAKVLLHVFTFHTPVFVLTIFLIRVLPESGGFRARPGADSKHQRQACRGLPICHSTTYNR